ncbi:RIO1 family regulatory kinase/ATPase [Kineosporia sp. NBRC 101731]|uniref:serine protein kinase RIO n=1 Tax=Kineosporia sp. NBRC 101731 TaxID=3032199 RepID=UPI0024A4D0BF|nr:RIO1 family regulatory kinase/ATPase [Kineosporia sp. NBRC 101731]GLY32249.1 RIO kinase 1 [Kineosporia sp. NBRC 101731]
MHENDHEFGRRRRGRRRFDDELNGSDHLGELTTRSFRPEPELDPDAPATGDRWSTWGDTPPTGRGPRPHPDWLVIESAAVDTDLGLLKTGKEADVSLMRRGVPDTDRSCLLACKQYRLSEHRMFHRDAGYMEGRRMRESRSNRAMSRRTDFGRELISEQWAGAEFAALSRLWQTSQELGRPVVPYPVQILGTELLMEFVGDHATGQGAPRLAQVRPTVDDAKDLWQQAVSAIGLMARCGLAHGDLSAYNVLVHEGHLVLIDLPQVVDLIANPYGPKFLYRDVGNLATWFGARGVPGIDARRVTQELLAEAGVH